jgi:glycosyltransferase involved in cell wall biosynthesis
MRIAFVTPEHPACGPSHGVGTYVDALTRALASAGHTVLVVVGDDHGWHAFAPGESPRTLSPRAARPLLRPWTNLSPAWAELRRFAPEVVEHSSWGGLGARDLGPWLRAVRLSTPVIAIRPEDALRGLLRHVHHHAELRTVRQSHLVIADSHAMAELGARCYGRPADTVIHHGWDPPAILPPVMGGADVLYVGRLEHRKGIDTLLAAWATVRGIIPAAVLHLVGADRHAYGAEQVKRFGGDGVRVHGRLEPAALAAVRATCRIQVIPSRFESFGMVALEAWAGGQAVVASRCGGLGELVDDAGVLVAVEDAHGLAMALAGLLSDETRCRDLAERGARRLARFAVPGWAAATIAAYEKALASRPGTPGRGAPQTRPAGGVGNR